MNKVVVPLVVAIVLGFGAVLMIYSMAHKRHMGPVTVVTPAKMVVAKKAIMPGQNISADDLGTVPVGDKKKLEGTFASIDDVGGRIALMPIGENQPVLASMLADPRAGAGLQALLPDGSRAITLQVDEVSGVGGLLVPGCHVDLLTSLHSGGVESLTSRTLVQDVKVIAVGQSLGPPSADGGMPRSVTLVVSPQQAETIELASNVGRPRLVLRSGADHAIVQSPGVSLAEIDGTKPLAQVADSSGVRSVTIIRGGTESTVTFSDGMPVANNASSASSPSVAGIRTDAAPIGTR